MIKQNFTNSPSRQPQDKPIRHSKRKYLLVSKQASELFKPARPAGGSRLLSKRYIFSLLTLLLLVGCHTSSKYDKLIETEMSKDIRHDSIFLGFNFGKPRADFFTVCKELNGKKLVIQSDKSGFVQFLFPNKNEANKDLKVLFWGTFNKEKIMTGLKFEFSHIAWAPWNKASEPENLIPIIKDKFLEWFPGNDFISIPSVENEKNNWVKIDGNRRIVISAPDNVSTVKATIDDLRLTQNQKFEH